MVHRDENGAAAGSQNRKQFNACLDEIIAQAFKEPQSELFYSQKARELQELSPDYIAALTRRLQKADLVERDVLVQLLAQFSGVEHVSFLQDFVGRETFMPATGMKILDIFNKSDVIIEGGLAGRLLDYDNFAQRINRALMDDTFEDALVAQYCACPHKQRDGIAAQLLEERASLCAPFLARVCAADKKAGERILDMLEGCGGEKGFRVMEAMYAADGRKDILKRMKKAARALAQKGIQVTLPRTREKDAPVFKSASLSPARAFASTIDPEGCRMLFIIKPVSTQEAKIFQILTSDVKGIGMIDVAAAYRGEISQLVKKLSADTKSDFREIDTARCVALAMEAVEIARADGQIVPATVAQLEAHFADLIGENAAPAVYSVLSEQDIASPGFVPDMAALIEELDAAFWYIASPEGRACWDKIAAEADSAGADREAVRSRLSDMEVEARASFFTDRRRAAFKRRLEEFAWILHAQGSTEHARAALAAALSLAAPDHDPQRDAFCSGIIARAFEMFEKSLDEKSRVFGSTAMNAQA